MKFLADTANLDDLKRLWGYFPIIGITTNPSLIAKEKIPLSQCIPKILKIIGQGDIHIQVMASTAAGMLKEAKKYQDYFKLGNQFFAKIPITKEGLKSIPMIKDSGINATATAIYTPLQAELAANAGADYVIPYVNRIDNISGNGIDVISDIVALFDQSHHSCQILPASFKNVDQVYQTGIAGAHTASVPADILEAMIWHPMVDKAVKDFKTAGKAYYDIF